MRVTAAIAILSLTTLVIGCSAKRPPAPSQSVPQPSAANTSSLPFHASDITAVGDSFWVCGDGEGIAHSTDGGATWALSHKDPNGRPLSEISFANEKVGHAVGDDGLLLATEDGGRTWEARNGGGKIRHFSFVDSRDGIIVTSDKVLEPMNAMLDEVQGVAAVEGVVKLTHDGGLHWEEAEALRSDAALHPFSEILSVAALDSYRYLVAFREPQVAVGYAVTQDAGRSWKLIQLPNTYATRVYVHEGEYWAFGIEYLHREDHGGYGAPVSLHSKDGETWIHGARGPNEFATCTSQGCALWDGLVEDLYGEKARFWASPEHGFLSRKWAIASNRECAVDRDLVCAPVSRSDQPPPRPEGAKVQ